MEHHISRSGVNAMSANVKPLGAFNKRRGLGDAPKLPGGAARTVAPAPYRRPAVEDEETED
jgi:hypothetical protein